MQLSSNTQFVSNCKWELGAHVVFSSRIWRIRSRVSGCSLVSSASAS